MIAGHYAYLGKSINVIQLNFFLFIFGNNFAGISKSTNNSPPYIHKFSASIGPIFILLLMLSSPTRGVYEFLKPPGPTGIKQCASNRMWQLAKQKLHADRP